VAGIRVVTDSAADLPVELLKEHDIVVVPLDVRLGDVPASEMSSLTPAEFWVRVAQSDALAETSAPSPGAFRDAFAAAAHDGADGVVCVTLSSALSATFQSAVAGAAAVAGEIAVEVIDSRSVTMGEGFIVLDAAEAAARGGDLVSVAGAARASIGKVRVLGGLDSLETLRRGGRIGSAQAFFGSLLAIKPVIEVRDGVVAGESRQRTRSRSLRYLADKVAEAGPLERLAVAHAAAGDLDVFLEMLAGVRPAREIVVTHIGAVIGAHTGPGTMGVCLELV
jgi:DegV family protein with EDD domain